MADTSEVPWSDETRAAAEILGDVAAMNRPLGRRTTYRVGGPAAVTVELTDHTDVALVSEAIRRSGVKVLVLGRGSNLLVSDRGFDGLVLDLGEDFARVTIDTDGRPPKVVAGGQVLLPVLARRTVAAGLTGFEWAVGVPGSLGGAVRMNAGGHGSDISEVLESARVLDLDTGRVAVRCRDSLGLRFRGSEVGPAQVVLEATLRLRPGDVASGEEKLSEIVAWRRDHQPGGQNAGSVFVNPDDGSVPAGLLIDRSGLKGMRLGTAEVSEKHANFIQADEGGSAEDVARLMVYVADRVSRDHGVHLRTEIRLVGFDPELLGRLAAVNREYL